MKETKPIPLDKFFKIIKPEYIYIKILPHKSIRNYNSSNIAKSIALSWKSINKVIRLEQKKVWIEFNFKVSYIIDIKDKDVSFYFIVPTVFKNIILEKMKEIWAKATIQESDPIQPLDTTSTIHQVYYKKEDGLSLEVDKKSNEPLNSILNVIDVMKDDDRVTIAYNFHPTSQYGWREEHKQTINKFKQKRPLEKDKGSFSYILKFTLGIVFEITDIIIASVGDIFGGAKNNSNNVSFVESVITSLEGSKTMTSETKKKGELNVLNTEILVASKSNDSTREINNLHSVTSSYRVLDSDNELQSKPLKSKHKKHLKFENNFWNCITNKFSTDECQNFIQVPAYSLLNQLGISHVKTNENPVPEELQNGVKRLGTVSIKGKIYKSFLEDKYNTGNLPLVTIGGQGAGKTTLMCNYCKDCIDANEGIIVIDFIKNCELSDSIKKHVPKERLVELDLASENDIQGLGYNEIQVTENMSNFEKLNLANMQSQQIMALIDSIVVGDPLSSRMRRFLNSAANVTFSLGYSSIKDIIRCLEDYEFRLNVIDSLDSDLRTMLEDEIKTLNELNEYSKKSKDNPDIEVVGTRESKIEHILDRVSMLRENFKLKYMYNKPLDSNINLVDSLEKGKVILLKMREDEFGSKMVKNIMVTYWVSKIWLTCQLRGRLNEKPLRCNIIIDEVFQAPTCMSTLEYIIPQSRKFGCKFVFSTQYIRQLEKIFDTLEACGSSYMLLRGCLEDDFNHFKNKFIDFEYEDLRDMGETYEYPSLNLIYYSKGYSSFISKLPPELK